MKLAIFTALLSTLSLHAAPLPPAKELARNEVLAVYLGTKELPCMHRTALCPDRCDHAKTVAVFEVMRNDGYEKKGEYGDQKAEAGQKIYVDVNKDLEGQSPETLKMIKELKMASQVQMTQVHYYVTTDKVSYPVRPITEIKPRLVCSVPPTEK